MDNNVNTSFTPPTSDERLLALLAHLSIMFGGIILPIILWATQKDRSRFVTYNSLLALFFHISYAALIIIFVIIMFVAMIISGAAGAGGFNNSSPEMPMAMLIIIIVFYAGIIAVIFAGIGYGVYLAIKAYQGKLVSIPVLGNIVYKKVYGEN